MSRRSIVIRPVAVLGALALVLAGCGDDDAEDTSGTTTSAPAVTTTAGPSTTAGPTTTAAPDETALTVYFVWNEAVAAAGAPGSTPTDAVEALLAGPDEFETEIGMGTEIPKGTELLGVDVTDGVATVDLTAAFQSGGGSLSMQARVAQVVFTLTAFPDIERVSLALDGEPVEYVGGEGVPAADLTRADAANVTPMILVESPVPGEEVTSPLSVSGIANTFEGTVNYTLTDPDGLILEEGFTTAAMEEMGQWGPFELTIDFSVDREGLGALIVYEISPRDGSQQHLMEIPLRMSP
ncbi:MAG: GerMN domain-containing protein [Acidimicrobiia bacterium]|nr:GerMN domain-containing protein [Acidimicrobiia bacterium]